jgi:hypothetical protein
MQKERKRSFGIPDKERDISGIKKFATSIQERRCPVIFGGHHSGIRSMLPNCMW